MDTLIRSFDASIDDVNQVDRTIVARVNVASLDRLNSIIDPKGGNLEAYRKNPVVLWEHGKDPRRFTDPIGRNLWIKSSGGNMPSDLLGKTRFLEDDFSQQRFEWYRDGTLNAFSVRVMPLEWGPPTRDEVKVRPELANDRPNETRGAFDGPLIYRKWELTEYSGTAVPGNADCLVAGRAASLLNLVERGLLWMPDDVKPLVEAAARTMTESVGGQQGGGGLVRYITHEDGGKWIVHAEDGKVLGEHDSESDAKAQLAAIEARKHDEKKGESRSAPYVDTDGQTWTVRDRDGSELIAFPDAGMADRCLRAMGEQRSFGAVHSEAILSDRAFYDELKKDVVALLNLELLGRV